MQWSAPRLSILMARGNARQKIVRDDGDRRRLVDGLEHVVVRRDWELLRYVVMGNHLHLMVKTPRANLSVGMQSFLSGYAIWAGPRWRRTGHLVQGRYRAEMIEDESYCPIHRSSRRDSSRVRTRNVFSRP